MQSKLYQSIKSVGKPVINARKMVGERPIELSDIDWIFEYPEMKLENLTESKFLYINENKEISEVKSINELKKLIKSKEIWEIPLSEYELLGENYTTKAGTAIVTWQYEDIKLLIKRIDEKIEKFETYKKFKENNLAIFTFMFSEDFNDAEKLIKEHYYNKYMPFDNIYLCDYNGTVKVIKL